MRVDHAVSLRSRRCPPGRSRVARTVRTASRSQAEIGRGHDGLDPGRIWSRVPWLHHSPGEIDA